MVALEWPKRSKCLLDPAPESPVRLKVVFELASKTQALENAFKCKAARGFHKHEVPGKDEGGNSLHRRIIDIWLMKEAVSGPSRCCKPTGNPLDMLSYQEDEIDLASARMRGNSPSQRGMQLIGSISQFKHVTKHQDDAA